MQFVNILFVNTYMGRSDLTLAGVKSDFLRISDLTPLSIKFELNVDNFFGNFLNIYSPDRSNPFSENAWLKPPPLFLRWYRLSFLSAIICSKIFILFFLSSLVILGSMQPGGQINTKIVRPLLIFSLFSLPTFSNFNT